MVLGILLLLAGLTISAVAIYYSVLGLAAIFAAATIPIYVMGGVLEVSKLIAASWLKANWNRATSFIKWYMSFAVVILMMITSMGIFGFLSKAHLDQAVPTGDVAAQVALIDEKIKTQRDNIEAARAALTQMDAQVTQRLSGRNVDQSAERSVQIRRQQAPERTRLQAEISTAQKEISKLNEERAPVASQLRKVEAEVGPIKYIAQFVYGQEADQNILEKAVTWVIILIVIVFDPLAVAMLLAAQMTFGWYRKDKEQSNAVINTNNDNVSGTDKGNDIRNSGSDPVVENDVKSDTAQDLTTDFDITKHPYLFKGGDFWNKPEGWIDAGPMVYKPEPVVEETTPVVEETTPVSLDLPPIIMDEPKYQILPELIEESSKKKIYDQGPRAADSSGEEVIYKQNSEQSESSLWNRIRDRISTGFRPKDYLFVAYSKGGFEDFQYDPIEDPELDKFIIDIKTGKHSFGDYPVEKLQYFASKIYELREN